MGAGSPWSGSHVTSSSSNQRNGLWERDKEEEAVFSIKKLNTKIKKQSRRKKQVFSRIYYKNHEFLKNVGKFILLYTISQKFEEKGWMKKLDGGGGGGKG